MKRLLLLLPLLALASGCASPAIEPTELRIRDESGHPLESARVRWQDRWGERHGLACVDKMAVGDSLSDQTGKADLPPLLPGRHRTVEIVLPSTPAP